MAPLTNSVAFGQDVYNIGLSNSVWDHSTLSLLIIPADNQSWWDPSFVANVQRAVGQWNDAIREFAANYSDYAYISDVNIQTTVSSVIQPGYDIYIYWTETLSNDTSQIIGLTSIYADNRGILENCTMRLSAKTNLGNALSSFDMQNIALHELGHTLALGHSNYTGDVMYPIYNMGGYTSSVSTLDVYGVATMFAWKLDPADITPVSDWLNESYVSLPSSIPYQYFSISAQNSPPLTVIDNPISQFFIVFFTVIISNPYLTGAVISAIILVTVVGILTRQKKRQHH